MSTKVSPEVSPTEASVASVSATTPPPAGSDALRAELLDEAARHRGSNYADDLADLLRRAAAALASSPAPGGDAVRRMVGCEDANGLLRVHPESETCEVCAATPAPAVGREAAKRFDLPWRAATGWLRSASGSKIVEVSDHRGIRQDEAELIAAAVNAYTIPPAEAREPVDGELPGMWSASDFTAGDPDERSYAERAEAREPVGDAELRQQRDAAEQRAATLSRMLEERTFPSVEVTDAMVERGLRWYWPHDMKYADNQRDFMRRFLEATLAQPRDTPRDSGDAADAARYRFLRDPKNSIVYAMDWVNWNEVPHSGRSHFRYEKPEQLDAAIDAQLAAMQSPTGEPK